MSHRGEKDTIFRTPRCGTFLAWLRDKNSTLDCK